MNAKPLGLVYELRKKQEKASAINTAMVTTLRGLDEVPQPVNYSHLSKISYERNVTVHACMNVIMNAVASSANWILFERPLTKGGKIKRRVSPAFFKKAYLNPRPEVKQGLDGAEVESHAALDLLENPNPLMPKATYLKQASGFYLLHGNSYEEFVALRSGPPVEMYNLRPDRMEILPGGRGNVVGGYRYEIDGNSDTRQDFEPESVIHRRMFHPTHDWYGLSPLQAGLRVLQTDNSSIDWNLSLSKNMMRPPGALIAPTTLNDEKSFNRLKEEINDSYMGASGAGRPLFLEGGLDWKQMGLTPTDTDWINGIKMTTQQLCALYGVPPEIIGDTEHQAYDVYDDARKALYLETALPLLDEIRDAYNDRLLPLYGDRFFLDYDRDQIDAIQEDQERLFRRIRSANWLSVNQKLVATKFPPIDHPLADTPTAFIGDNDEVPDASLLDDDRTGVGGTPTHRGRQGANGSAEDDPLEDDDGRKTPTSDSEKAFNPRIFGGGQRRARKQLKSKVSELFADQGEALAKFTKGRMS